MQMNKMVNEK